ncbi:MAG: hypothetical protein R3E97_07680 [Candidatus Eisenbacteria bacterium]
MENQYRIPKQRVATDITFSGSPSVRLNLYLSECAQTHAGYERPSDLLNGESQFIPATQTDGAVVILNRDLIRTVEVESSFEFGGPGRNGDGPDSMSPYSVTSADIEVTLSDRTKITGTVSFSLPGSQRRVQDFMNLGEQFLVIRKEDHAVLVNKTQIQSVAIV